VVGGLKKKKKMSDEELHEKAKPLMVIDSILDYELPSIVFKPTGYFFEDESVKNILPNPYLPDFSKYDCDPKQLDNVEFRKRLSNMVHTGCYLHKIFPTLIPGFRARINLTVEWPNEQRAYWGNELPPKIVVEAPVVSYPDTNVLALWTLIMVGQEIDRPEIEYDHWVITNIPKNVITEGQVLSPYICPTPTNDGGLHRCTFILSQQKDRIPFNNDIPEPSSDIKHRNTFKTVAFLQKIST